DHVGMKSNVAAEPHGFNYARRLHAFHSAARQAGFVRHVVDCEQFWEVHFFLPSLVLLSQCGDCRRHNTTIISKISNRLGSDWPRTLSVIGGGRGDRRADGTQPGSLVVLQFRNANATAANANRAEGERWRFTSSRKAIAATSRSASRPDGR